MENLRHTYSLTFRVCSIQRVACTDGLMVEIPDRVYVGVWGLYPAHRGEDYDDAAAKVVCHAMLSYTSLIVCATTSATMLQLGRHRHMLSIQRRTVVSLVMQAF